MMKRMFFFLFLVAVSAVPFASCFAQSAEPVVAESVVTESVVTVPVVTVPVVTVPVVLGKIRVGYIPFNADLPFFVAMEKGFFEDEGIEVEAKRFSNSSLAFTAMQSGRVDALAGSAFSMFFKRSQAVPGKFKMMIPFAEVDTSVMSYVIANKKSGINKLEDLKGKKVGTYSGSTQVMYLNLFLKEIGLTPGKDVTVRQVPSGLQVEALASRQLDALFTVDPYGTMTIEAGAGKVVEENPRSKYLGEPFWVGAAAVDMDFYNNKPLIVKKLYNAMKKAVDFIDENEAESKTILTKFTPMDENTASKSGLYKWYKLGDPVDFESIQKLADTLYEKKLLTKKVDVKPLFFTKEALN